MSVTTFIRYTHSTWRTICNKWETRLSGRQSTIVLELITKYKTSSNWEQKTSSWKKSSTYIKISSRKKQQSGLVLSLLLFRKVRSFVLVFDSGSATTFSVAMCISLSSKPSLAIPKAALRILLSMAIFSKLIQTAFCLFTDFASWSPRWIFSYKLLLKSSSC